MYRRILTSLVFETLVKYLQVQSSQWHTLKTKQFSYYEQTRSQTVPEKEDGLETLMYLLRYLLQHLPETVLVLTGSSVDECPLGYFCSMVADRLRAEPYLFNPYLNLLAAIADTSKQSADAVYEFIEKAPTEHVSWALMTNALNEGERLLHSDSAQRGLLDPDVTGFIAILGLFTSVLRHGSACPNIRSNLQVDTVTLCLRLLHHPVHVMLKAGVCSLLSCVACDTVYAQSILRQLELGRIVTADSASGIAYELENVESPSQAYPLTASFLRLVLTVIHSLSPRVVLASSIFPSLFHFVLHTVFLRLDQRSYLPTRPGEKWTLGSLCFQFLSTFLTLFDQFASNVLSDADRPLQQRLMGLVVDLLCGDDILRKVRFQGLPHS